MRRGLAVGLAALACGCAGPAGDGAAAPSTTDAGTSVGEGLGTAPTGPPPTTAPTSTTAPPSTTATTAATATTTGGTAPAPPAAPPTSASGAARRGAVDRDRPCEVPPRSFDGTPVNRVEREVDGLVTILVADPLCTASGGSFAVSVAVRNVSGRRVALSSARPVVGGLYVAGSSPPEQVWGFPCPPRGGGVDDPPDTPSPLEPGESVELLATRHEAAEPRCGVPGTGLFDLRAVVRSCTRLEGVCDAARAHPTADLRLQRR